MESISKKLQANPGIKFLELEDEVGEDTDGFEKLVCALTGNKSVRYIYLCGEFFDSLNGEQRIDLFSAIASLASLQSLHLANATLSNDSAKDLGIMLLACRSDLQEVCFQHLHIPRNVTLDTLVYSIAKLPALEKVEIGILFMHHNEAAFSPESLVQLCRSGTVQSLTLVDTRLTESHFVAMSQELERNESMKELQAWGEHISAKSGVSVADMIKVNSSIHTLCLYFATIENSCIEALAESMCYNTTLTSLSIENEDNSITEEGFVSLSQMLKKNTHIESLTLISKGLGDASCTLVCSALSNHPSLKHLCLDNGLGDEDEEQDELSNELNFLLNGKTSNQPVGKAGILAIAEMLKTNTSIERLDISNLPIDSIGVVDLATSLCCNSTVHEVNLGPISQKKNIQNGSAAKENEVAQKAILHMLLQNKTLGNIIITDEEQAETILESKTQLLLRLNQSRLRQLMVDVNRTREGFVRKLASHSHDLDCLYSVLVMNPSCIAR